MYIDCPLSKFAIDTGTTGLRVEKLFCSVLLCFVLFCFVHTGTYVYNFLGMDIYEATPPGLSVTASFFFMGVIVFMACVRYISAGLVVTTF